MNPNTQNSMELTSKPVARESKNGQNIVVPKARPKQRGAALFTALMLLIILSILGVAAARVTALQERMVSVYLADIESFQAAEDLARDSERIILATDSDEACYQGRSEKDTLPGTWFEAEGEPLRLYKNLGQVQGMALQNSAQAGEPLETGGPGCTFFRVSTLEFDEAGGESRTIVETVYVP